MSNGKKDEEFSFIKEKIKDKPINKKRLVFTVLFCTGLAVVFGCVVSLSFVLSKPGFEKIFDKEAEPDMVSIPQDETSTVVSDSVNESEIDENNSQQEPDIPLPKEEEEEKEPETIVVPAELKLEDFKTLYHELNLVAKEARKFTVTVTGVTSDLDWFNDTLESKGQASGIIIADNSQELFVLTAYDILEGAEKITVTFNNDTVCDAQLKQHDKNTSIAVIGIPIDSIEEDTMENIKIAPLGNSYAASQGDMIIAIGSPLGYSESLSYGILTSTNKYVSTIDANYRVLTTDAVGSVNGTGAIVNMAGEVIGIIAPEYNPDSTISAVAGLGISDLKSIIEKLSNNQEMVYLGIKGSDVTEDISEEQKLPIGVYVTEVIMDMCAMSTGIQSGDVIVNVGGTDIKTMRDLKTELIKYLPDQVIEVKAMRQGMDEYKEISFTVTLTK